MQHFTFAVSGTELNLLGGLLGLILGSFIDANTSPNLNSKTGRPQHPNTGDIEGKNKGFIWLLLGKAGAIAGSFAGAILAPKFSPILYGLLRDINQVGVGLVGLLLLLILYSVYESQLE